MSDFPIPERAKRARAVVVCPDCGRTAVPARYPNERGKARLGPLKYDETTERPLWWCPWHGEFLP